MTEQNAVDIVRKVLLEYPEKNILAPWMASKKLVEEAYDKQSGDNLSAIVVAFNKPKIKTLSRLLVESNDSGDAVMTEASKSQKIE